MSLREYVNTFDSTSMIELRMNERTICWCLTDSPVIDAFDGVLDVVNGFSILPVDGYRQHVIIELVLKEGVMENEPE